MWVRPLNSMRWPAGKCLPLHFQPLPDSVCNTYMFQEDSPFAHSPFAQEGQGNLSKLLSPSSTHIFSYQMLWKAGHGSHQHHHPRPPGPTPILILPRQIHRWRKLYCTPYCPFPPGQKEHLREYAVHWLQETEGRERPHSHQLPRTPAHWLGTGIPCILSCYFIVSFYISILISFYRFYTFVFNSALLGKGS